jgi:hypothetical protein
VNGGDFGATDGTAGGLGRLILGINSTIPGNMPNLVPSDAITNTTGPGATNPFISGGNTSTPYLPDLVGGAEVFGLTNVTSSDPSLASVVANAPSGATAAVVLADGGVAGFDQYPGYDLLLLVNLTSETLNNPQLGVGAAGFETVLLQGGYQDGGTPQTLAQLGPNQVYAMLVPAGSVEANVAFQAQGTTYSASPSSLSTSSTYFVTSADVVKATPTVNWANPADITYGQALGTAQLDASASVPGSFSYTLADDTTPANDAVLHAGQTQTLNVTFTPNDTTDFSTATAQVEINVDPATLTVTANEATKTYGTANPTFTATISGLVNGDSLSVVSGTPSLTTPATSASAAGSYQISAAQGTLSAADYTFTFQSGTLTVTPATPTILVNPVNITYGTALSNPQLSGTAEYDGNSVAGTFSYTNAVGTVLAASPNGQIENVTFTPNDATDYSAVIAQAQINVAPATLTVTADDASKTSGTANPEFGDTITGFVNGDGPSIVSGAPSLTTTATTASPAGTYTITVGSGTLSAANYTFAFQNGTLTVNPAPVTSGGGSTTSGGNSSSSGGSSSGNSGGSPTIGTSSGGSTSPPPASNLTPTERYVTAVYNDVLGRAPDPGGLAYWSGLITNGAPISSVAEQIGHSPEYYTNFVIQPDYQKLLHRAGTPTEVQGLVTEMQQGLTDQGVEAQLVATDEFFANSGSNDKAWVDAVYSLMLGRQADPSGEAWWTNLLAQGQSRSQVANQIADSNENNTQLINDDYFHYLGRAADPQGLAWWLQQFKAGQTNEDVIAGFTGSGEYYSEHTS